MLIYFAVFAYLSLLYILRRNRVKFIDIVLAVLPVFLLTGLKAISVGSDTLAYYNRYVGAERMLMETNNITEPGFNYISFYFHNVLGVSFYTFDAAIAAFVCVILGLFLKKYSDNVYLSVFFYMTIGLFTMSMSGLRQMMAISLCSVPLLFSNRDETRIRTGSKKWTFQLIVGIVCVLVAYTFHNSALVFLPIIFLLNLRFTKPQIIIITIIAIFTILVRSILVNYLAEFAPGRYERYDFKEGYLMNTLMLLIPIAISLFCALLSKPDHNDGRYGRSISLMFIFLALQVMFSNLALSHNQIARLGYYFMNSYIILIPFALRSLNRRLRIPATMIIIVICLVFFYIGTKGGTLMIDDYKFFWQDTAIPSY